tara:strand:+ start:232 stop:1392 length:1161 start_codon:yes stop_codon:yes gene_type:complete
MAWKRKLYNDTTDNLPTGLASWKRISTYIKRLIRANAFEFYELEALEVTKVYLDEPGMRGHIEGKYLRPDGESTGIIRPLWPNVITVPLVGEHVIVGEYSGELFYGSIINRLNSVNENALSTEGGSKWKDFRRKKVKPIQVNEGSVLYEGRVGQGIHFDSRGNKPTIKLSTNIDKNSDKKWMSGIFRNESIDDDDSSIYITSEGLRGQKFNSQEVKNNSVLIRSDDILINGRKKIVLEADEVFIHARSGQTIKMGDPRAIFIPTIDAKAMAELMKNLMSFVTKTMGAIGKATNPATLVSAAKDIKKAVGQDLPSIVDTVKNEKYLNKKVMVADPNIPIPKIPKIPDPNKLKEKWESDINKRIPDLPSVDNLKNKVISNIEEELTND